MPFGFMLLGNKHIIMEEDFSHSCIRDPNIMSLKNN